MSRGVFDLRGKNAGAGCGQDAHVGSEFICQLEHCRRFAAPTHESDDVAGGDAQGLRKLHKILLAKTVSNTPPPTASDLSLMVKQWLTSPRGSRSPILRPGVTGTLG